jgi:hypothetical protein
MPSLRPLAFVGPCLLLAACAVGTTDKPHGTNIGALRDDPAPQPPSDLQSLDMKAAVEEALRIGGITTLAAAWQGHLAVLQGAPATCPQVFLGLPPDSVLENVNVDLGDDADPGYSWAAACLTPNNVDYEGFAHWTTTITPGASGSRTLLADATVLDGGGNVLFSFLGDASDTVDVLSGSYDSTINGKLEGSLVGLGTGLQTGGDFVASLRSDGTLNLTGSVTMFDGFGPPDHRDPAKSPELKDIAGWTDGEPRFTSATFDLEFQADCPQEPYGYVGLRGNEGFWFDVYFLPKYTAADTGAPSAQIDAFPYEQIDNVTCDGVGTLFARNVDLKGWDDCDPKVVGVDGDCDPSWSRELSPDFAGVVGAMTLPTLDSYIYNVRDIPQE